MRRFPNPERAPRSSGDEGGKSPRLLGVGVHPRLPEVAGLRTGRIPVMVVTAPYVGEQAKRAFVSRVLHGLFAPTS